MIIRDNHILGGGYSLAHGNYFPDGTYASQKIVVTGNTFGTKSGGGQYGYAPGTAYPAELPYLPATSDPSGPGGGVSGGCVPEKRLRT